MTGRQGAGTSRLARIDLLHSEKMGHLAMGAALGAVATLLLVAMVSGEGTGKFFYDYQTLIVGLAAALVAVAAAIAAWLSFRTAQLQTHVARIQAQAAIFPVRMAVFQAAKEFLRPWFAQATPDLNHLPNLVDAWQRSKFLFDQSVTDFLRQLWRDAVKADYYFKIVDGRAEGDTKNAIEQRMALMLKYLGGEADDPDVLVEAFRSMKIDVP